MNYIWEINIKYDGLTTVILPEILQEEFVFLIFIQENVEGKSSGELKVDDKDVDTDYEGSGYDGGPVEYDDGHGPSREGSGDGNDFEYPSFDEVAKNPERCIEKIKMVEKTVYDDEVICKHQYSEECHNTYITDYKPQQKEVCKEKFLKRCFIRQKQHASQENVHVCNTPLICSGEGSIVLFTSICCWSCYKRSTFLFG